ncbi:MAG: hypothetical protein WKG01_37185 [Kofleriaceae bacterium]
MLRFMLLCVLTSSGCQRDNPGPAAAPGRGPDRTALGRERNDCRDDSTCDPGLLCLSNLCVKPPPADCTVVAETFTSFELGNYADPDERAPLVAKLKAQCETAYVTKDEGMCLEETRDKYSATACVPRMFPASATKATTGDCAQVAATFRTTVTQQMPQADPKTKAMLDSMIGAIHKSCSEDQWPAAVIQCYLGTTGLDALQQCDAATPPALKQKIQDRVMAAVQSVQR